MHYFTLVLTAAIVALNAVAVPMHPSSDAGSAYSGAGGNAPGGSVNQEPGLNGVPLLNAFSNNAGDGGDAFSGDAVGGDAWGKDGGGHSNLHKGELKAGDAYTGVGGQAPGGSVNNAGTGVINIFSGNAGGGGEASSGSSYGGGV